MFSVFPTPQVVFINLQQLYEFQEKLEKDTESKCMAEFLKYSSLVEGLF